MHEKRYQVFISSTFEDLKVERRAVQDVVISTGDFPVQMETFPAADEDQFKFIKSFIDQCDYYVLIIAGRYGTVAEDGLSYTHKEFRYAVSKGVPILVMLHGNRGAIATDNAEDSVAGKKRLNDFIAEAEKGRLRKTWESHEGLKLAVREALDYSKATKPRIGWVRGDAVASRQALEELNNVRRENDSFRRALGQLEIDIPLPEIPAADDVLEINLLPVTNSGGYHRNFRGSNASLKGTWISFFPIFFSNLNYTQSDWGGENHYLIDHDESCLDIGSALAGEVANIDTNGLFRISNPTLVRLESYYKEAGLMASDGGEPFTVAAQKLARRHRIQGDAGSNIKIVDGKIEVSSVEITKPTNLDDEIPF